MCNEEFRTMKRKPGNRSHHPDESLCFWMLSVKNNFFVFASFGLGSPIFLLVAPDSGSCPLVTLPPSHTEPYTSLVLSLNPQSVFYLINTPSANPLLQDFFDWASARAYLYHIQRDSGISRNEYLVSRESCMMVSLDHSLNSRCIAGGDRGAKRNTSFLKLNHRLQQPRTAFICRFLFKPSLKPWKITIP